AETIQLGEIEGYHHGCYREGWWHWYSRGYSPAGIETLNGIRGLDLLAHRSEVDPERLGVTGISGGGATTWWIAAADERVRAAAPVCGTATVFSHVHDRTIDGHCDCMWWTNTYRWDLADVGALVAPRPLLIASADQDGIFTIESIRQVHRQVAGVYRKLGAADHVRLVETPGGHSYHERSRTEIFSWFARHLQGREIPASEIGDIDDRPERRETVEALRVFAAGAPEGAVTARIHDVVFDPPPRIDSADPASLTHHRERVVASLRERTFGAFPENPPPLDLQREYAFDEDAAGCRFGFTSERGWRLHGQLLYRKPLEFPAPALVAPRLPGEGRWDTRGFLLRLREPWARIAVEPRGVGDTAWGDDLQWHLRRAAAWTGRTLASMRVWDVLRALRATRELPEVDPDQISLAGRGEMAAVVLYAALLDGRIRRVFLENPPATQNVPGEKDGRGPTLEMLNCLRIADLPQVAALLWPTQLVWIGDVPAAYEETEAVYRRLGAPGSFQRVRDLGEWKSS
ncbi:MAG: prolyl oligopeptidase family serine peptidase, partial [Verrucomicrobiales bacterium]|nr:prolyl oligopeptidase family serine peptidase [Verrucomicrobiales bacterium]